jgi:uncharacterized membrane protein YtjA (UPF0391 family)
VASDFAGEAKMLFWSAAFLGVAMVAGMLGFGGLATSAGSIAKILFLVFLVLAVFSLVLGRRRPM